MIFISLRFLCCTCDTAVSSNSVECAMVYVGVLKEGRKGEGWGKGTGREEGRWPEGEGRGRLKKTGANESIMRRG